MIALENEHFSARSSSLCSPPSENALSVIRCTRAARTFCFAQRLHDVGVTVVEEAAGFGVQRPHRRHMRQTIPSHTGKLIIS